MSTFTERIDSELKKRMLKRTSLCDAVGINLTAVAAWKKRGTIPAGDICFKIADFLGVDCRWLVTGEETDSEGISLEERKLLSAWNDLSDADKEELTLLMNFKNKANKEEPLSSDRIG